MSDWKRVSRRRPCPVCERTDWCMFVGPDDAPTAAICPRTPSDRQAGEGGYLHVLRRENRYPATRTVRVAIRDASDYGPMAAACRDAVDTSELQRLATSLGITTASLKRLRIGWSAEHRAWTFPMTDAAGRVRGIRLRLPNGRKLAVRGGHEGLFLPIDLADDDRLLVCEGVTDTAALLDLGFAAIGRPSCSGALGLVVDLVRAQRPAEVVVVADSDPPGQRGAESLAIALLVYTPAVRVVTPPAKDVREWRRQGATRDDVLVLIDSAPVRRLRVAVGRATQ